MVSFLFALIVVARLPRKDREGMLGWDGEWRWPSQQRSKVFIESQRWTQADTNSPVGRIRHSGLGGLSYYSNRTAHVHTHAQIHPAHLKANGTTSGNPQTNMVIKFSPWLGAYKTGDNESKRRGKILISASCTYYRVHGHARALFAVCVFARSLIWACPWMCVTACLHARNYAALVQWHSMFWSVWLHTTKTVRSCICYFIGLYSVITAPTATFTFFIMLMCAHAYKLRWR